MNKDRGILCTDCSQKEIRLNPARIQKASSDGPLKVHRFFHELLISPYKDFPQISALLKLHGGKSGTSVADPQKGFYMIGRGPVKTRDTDTGDPAEVA